MKRRSFLGMLGATAGALVVQPTRALAGTTRTPAQAAAAGTPDWATVRAQFRLPKDFAYFNTAGLGTSPRPVLDVLRQRTDRDEEAPSPAHNEDDYTRIRGKCARLLGPSCRAQDVAFVSTATEGVNAILNAVPLGRGDEIITSTHEHAAVIIAALHKSQTTGCVVKTFEPDLVTAQGNVDRIAALVTPKTKLILISHVMCTTGQLVPAAAIGRLAAERGVTYALDGAQSLAHVPFDIAATGAHYYTASCHKWLMGPKRTGLLYVRPDRQLAAVPTVVGAYSDAGVDFAKRTLTLRPNAQRFEYGTQNNALIYGLEAACDFHAAFGLDELWRRNSRLAGLCRSGLEQTAGVDILSPQDVPSRTAILTFRVKGRDGRTVAAALAAKKLRVRTVTEAGLNAVRLSFHICNDEEEVVRFLAELPGAMRGQ